jgi:hypothetical protein
VTTSVRAFLISAALLCSCGYRPLYGGEAPERFAVVGAAPLVADASVVAEVEAGVRAGLSRAGALRSGEGYPRVVVEVLRIDGSSAGIADVAGSPLARGTELGVVARAWIERERAGEPMRDTGDVRTLEVSSAASDARLESLRQADALRAAGRRLGERLARRILGEPDAPDDGS